MTEAEERDAFYQAIMDNWEDDTPRLVYADWLDERGDEPSRIRAELIRVQCELAGCQREKDLPPTGMREQEQQLEREVYEYFAQRGVLDIVNERPSFDRGFISKPSQLDPALFSKGTERDWATLGPIKDPGVSLIPASGRRRPTRECAMLTTSQGIK